MDVVNGDQLLRPNTQPDEKTRVVAAGAVPVAPADSAKASAGDGAGTAAATPSVSPSCSRVPAGLVAQARKSDAAAVRLASPAGTPRPQVVSLSSAFCQSCRR